MSAGVPVALNNVVISTGSLQHNGGFIPDIILLTQKKVTTIGESA